MEASAADTNFSSKARDIAYENWQESNTHRQVSLRHGEPKSESRAQNIHAQSNISNNESRSKDKQANIEGDKESVQKNKFESLSPKSSRDKK